MKIPTRRAGALVSTRRMIDLDAGPEGLIFEKLRALGLYERFHNFGIRGLLRMFGSNAEDRRKLHCIFMLYE